MSFRSPLTMFRPPRLTDLPDPAAVGLPAVAEAYVLRVREFYDARAWWNRRLYRLSGVLVILVGAMLPLLSTLEYSYKDLTVSLAGVVVAMMTSLRAFYRWDQSWV